MNRNQVQGTGEIDTAQGKVTLRLADDDIVADTIQFFAAVTVITTMATFYAVDALYAAPRTCA